MKATRTILIAALCCIGLAACTQQEAQQSSPATANAANAGTNNSNSSSSTSNGSTSNSSSASTDWVGVYTGELPCASCSGIAITLTLAKNDQYSLTSDYLGEKDGKFDEQGTFEWNDARDKIILSNGSQYLVGENQLFVLNAQGDKVTGPLADAYRLYKQQ